MIRHLGRVGGKTDAECFATLPEMLTLAKFPNVAIKATGAPSYSSGSYPFSSIHDYLHQIYDSFGAERMFWGTDITRMPCSWHECVLVFVDHQPWLPPEDLPWLMGRGIAQWIGWAREDWS